MKNACWQDGKYWLEGDPEFYFEVYRCYNNSLKYLKRVYFDCDANVYINNYNINLLSQINRSDSSQYNVIYLLLKEDEVETEWWTTDWDNREKPNPNVFPFDDHDIDRWYVGNNENINIFAEWVYHN